MKVLFLMFAFPDMNKSFNMYTTIVEEFVRNRHETVVVAPGMGSTGIKTENNIQILRVKTLQLKNVTNFIKGVSNIILPYQFERAIDKFFPQMEFDLIIAPTPPITLVDLASRLKLKHNAKFYLILRDIFPQNAVDLGFIKNNGLLYRSFRRKEIKLYEVADYIGCMSDGNISYLIAHNENIEQHKLHELKNFQKLYLKHGVNKKELKGKFNLKGKFVVVFGGNLGKPQQLENVLILAKSCEEYSNVIFIMLGEGVHLKKLSKKIVKTAIQNMRIYNTIPKTEYQDLLSICDLGLISLNANFTIPNIPSKTLDYFNVGIPVLASIDRATDYGHMIETIGAGLYSYAGDHKAFKRNFDILYANHELRRKMGLKGRQYFKKNLVPEIAYSTIISVIK